MPNHNELEPCQHTCPGCGTVWSHTAEGAKPIHCIIKDVNGVRCLECQCKHELARVAQYRAMLDLPPQTLQSNPWFQQAEQSIRLHDMSYDQIEQHLTTLLAVMTMLKSEQAAYHAARGRKMQDMSDSERRALYDEHEKRKLARRAVKEAKIEVKGQSAGARAVASLARKGVDMSKLDEMLAKIRAKATTTKEDK